MTIQQARKVARKQRRKKILTWYRFLKSEMKNPSLISRGYMIFIDRGRDEIKASRLLCKKDNRFKIISKNQWTVHLIWKEREGFIRAGMY